MKNTKKKTVGIIITVVLILGIIVGSVIVPKIKWEKKMHVKEVNAVTDISQFAESCVEYNPLVNRNESELIGKPVKITVAVNAALNNGEYIEGFAKNEVLEQEAAESKEFADRVYADLGEQPSTLTEHVGNVLTWTGTTISIYNRTEYKPIEGDIITVYGIYDGYTDEIIDSGAPTISCVSVDCCGNIIA